MKKKIPKKCHTGAYNNYSDSVTTNNNAHNNGDTVVNNTNYNVNNSKNSNIKYSKKYAINKITNFGINISANGKLILCGEHAVMHGYPSISFAINQKIDTKITCRNDNKIIVNSDKFGKIVFLLLKKKNRNIFYINDNDIENIDPKTEKKIILKNKKTQKKKNEKLIENFAENSLNNEETDNEDNISPNDSSLNSNSFNNNWAKSIYFLTQKLAKTGLEIDIKSNIDDYGFGSSGALFSCICCGLLLLNEKIQYEKQKDKEVFSKKNRSSKSIKNNIKVNGNIALNKAKTNNNNNLLNQKKTLLNKKLFLKTIKLYNIYNNVIYNNTYDCLYNCCHNCDKNCKKKNRKAEKQNTNYKNNATTDHDKNKKISNTAINYYKNSKNNERNIKPSGADIATSIFGGLIYYNPKTKNVINLDHQWLDKIGIVAIYTGYKTSTIDAVKKITKNAKNCDKIYKNIGNIADNIKNKIDAITKIADNEKIADIFMQNSATTDILEQEYFKIEKIQSQRQSFSKGKKKCNFNEKCGLKNRNNYDAKIRKNKYKNINIASTNDSSYYYNNIDNNQINNDKIKIGEITTLLKKNQLLLKKLNLTDDNIEHIITCCEQQNIPAKISGSGLGDCVIAFTTKKNGKINDIKFFKKKINHFNSKIENNNDNNRNNGNTTSNSINNNNYNKARKEAEKGKNKEIENNNDKKNKNKKSNKNNNIINDNYCHATADYISNNCDNVKNDDKFIDEKKYKIIHINIDDTGIKFDFFKKKKVNK